MTDQVQKLNQQIAEYKIRLFDMQEAYNQVSEVHKELNETLGQIAAHLELKPNEDGGILLGDIVEAIKDLVSSDEEAAGETV